MTPEASVSAWLARQVEAFNDRVTARKGVVDLVSSDRFFASFGAVRPCGMHQEAAAACAAGIVFRLQFQLCPGLIDIAVQQDDEAAPGLAPILAHPLAGLAELRLSCAVCNDKALCGDFGSETQQRYMIIGGVSSLVTAVERVAVQAKVPILIDDQVHANVETKWNCRLHDSVIYAKRGTQQALLVWELSSENNDTGTSFPDDWGPRSLGSARLIKSAWPRWTSLRLHVPVQAHEDGDGVGEEKECMFMYDVGRRASNPWNLYNMVVKMWLAGRSCGGNYVQRNGVFGGHGVEPLRLCAMAEQDSLRSNSGINNVEVNVERMLGLFPCSEVQPPVFPQRLGAGNGAAARCLADTGTRGRQQGK
eukprot:gene12727-biopygen2231